MKFTTTVASLAPAIAEAVRIVERRNVMAILSNLRLHADGDALTITVTDLDMVLTTRVPAQVEAPGETTVDARTLGDIVRRLPERAPFVFDLPAGEPRAAIYAGRSRFALATLDPRDYPRIDEGSYSHSFRLTPKDLARLLGGSRPAASPSKDRPFLEGVCLAAVASDGMCRLEAVGTDGNFLLLARMNAPEGAAGMPSVIVPLKAADRLVGFAKGDEDVLVEVGSAKLRVSAGERTFMTRLIDGTYPDYARIIPLNYDKKAVLDIESITAAVERVGSIPDKANRVVFDLEAGRARLSLMSVDHGEASEDVDVEYSDAPIRIGLNGRYVTTVLAAIGGDTILASFGDAGSPALFANRAGDVIGVVMPMRHGQ